MTTARKPTQLAKTSSAAPSLSFALAKGDFVLVRAPKKNLLVEVMSVHNDEYDGVDAGSLDGDSLSFGPADILAYLPADFAPGATAFGVKLEAVRHVESGPLGPVAFYVPLEDADRKAFMESLTQCVEWLQSEGLLAEKEVEVSFRAPQGKWAGSYKHVAKESKPDALRLHTSLPPSEYDYVVSHEWGHHVWYNLVPDSLKSQWVSLYTKSIDVLTCGDKDLDDCLQAFKACDGDHKAAASECGNKPLYAEVLKVIKKTHRIRPHLLSSLSRAGSWDEVEAVWPQDAISMGEPEELLSEYAKVSPEELFAEAFANWYLRQQLPAALDSLMQETLDAASTKTKPKARAQRATRKRA